MPPFGLSIKVKSLFFDRAAVMKRVKSARRKVLSKAGAFVRRRAKSSIRKRKRISAAGQPPSSHVGTLQKLIYFGYDPSAESVVIGPVRFREGEAPGLLEHGGRTTITRRTRGDKGKRKRIRATYRARPYMWPALAHEAPQFPGLWADSVK